MSNYPEKDIFQPQYQFHIQRKFYDKIIQQFPHLSPSKANIISKAIVNKLCEGVRYPIELEEIIQKIYLSIIS
jgi:hypothetical protein